MESFLQIKCQCKKNHSRCIGRTRPQGKRQGTQTIRCERLIREKQYGKSE